ncbi:MAG TPA: HD domain-containing phosphohydrolase, partial [Candidatus Omnitrophota bacterium]|nr:HD domain-containing phosphohydrolase [Candidatus Omnitrophota bacterium]
MTTNDNSAAARLQAYAAPRAMVAIVTPDAALRETLGQTLAPSYRVSGFSDAATAARGAKPAAILVSESTREVEGVDAVAWLRRQTRLAGVPIVLCAMPGRPARGTAGRPDATFILPATGRDLLDLVSRLGNKAVEESWTALPPTPREALKRTLGVFNGIAQLIGSGSPMDYKDVSHACSPILEVVRQAGHHFVFAGLRNHNDHSYVHSLRMSTLLALFGHTIGLEEDSLMTLASAGLVHDIGKTVLPSEVMDKTSKLSPTEMEVAKSHVDATVRYLSNHSNVPRAVVTIAGQHHERVDGSGYPLGLKGEQLNDL